MIQRLSECRREADVHLKVFYPFFIWKEPVHPKLAPKLSQLCKICSKEVLVRRELASRTQDPRQRVVCPSGSLQPSSSPLPPHPFCPGMRRRRALVKDLIDRKRALFAERRIAFQKRKTQILEKMKTLAIVRPLLESQNSKFDADNSSETMMKKLALLEGKLSRCSRFSFLFRLDRPRPAC